MKQRHIWWHDWLHSRRCCLRPTMCYALIKIHRRWKWNIFLQNCPSWAEAFNVTKDRIKYWARKMQMFSPIFSAQKWNENDIFTGISIKVHISNLWRFWIVILHRKNFNCNLLSLCAHKNDDLTEQRSTEADRFYMIAAKTVSMKKKNWPKPSINPCNPP